MIVSALWWSLLATDGESSRNAIGGKLKYVKQPRPVGVNRQRKGDGECVRGRRRGNILRHEKLEKKMEVIEKGAGDIEWQAGEKEIELAEKR